MMNKNELAERIAVLLGEHLPGVEDVWTEINPVTGRCDVLIELEGGRELKLALTLSEGE